ncbi:hypothetical protein NUW54_g2193 [Trametes sanguinea]|uniref:Uncharacterized protein n=1 Tax=Trametes sanguinea TaxID=158606 RepID=A0ACC1Q4U8_9APHY|nr:hypothetical protein NUW54_g2193 [Trametes sanguinea]
MYSPCISNDATVEYIYTSGAAVTPQSSLGTFYPANTCLLYQVFTVPDANIEHFDGSISIDETALPGAIRLSRVRVHHLSCPRHFRAIAPTTSGCDVVAHESRVPQRSSSMILKRANDDGASESEARLYRPVKFIDEGSFSMRTGESPSGTERSGRAYHRDWSNAVASAILNVSRAPEESAVERR